MDFYNSAFGQNTQKMLGDYARYAKSIQKGDGVNASKNDGSAGAMQNQMMMLMMMMMSQMTGQSMPIDLLNQLPLPFVPGLPGTKPTNPAMISLESRFAQKATEQNPEAPTIEFTNKDIDAVKADLKAGVFTREELGQALMYQLAAGPDKFQPAIKKLIQAFTDSGDLNATSFLKGDYLKQLPEARKDTLLSALSGAGLTYDNNKPNTRLIGFTLEALGQPESSDSKAFVQKLLQKIQNDLGTSTDSARRKTLSQLLDLADISIDTQGKLTFP